MSKRRYETVTRTEAQEMVRLYEIELLSVRKVAGKMDRSYGAVYYHLKKAGVIRRPVNHDPA
jgi:hypothetical protein